MILHDFCITPCTACEMSHSVSISECNTQLLQQRPVPFHNKETISNLATYWFMYDYCTCALKTSSH